MRGLAIIWGFTALWAVAANPQHKIHEQMTLTERMQVFNSADEVPSYEIISIHWPEREKRSADGRTGMSLRAFGEDIKLWLQPSDSVLVGYDTPVYLLKTGPAGPEMRKYTNVMESLQGYEDLRRSAALVVRRGVNNTLSMMGTIGSSNLVVAPIPERLVEEARRKRRSAGNGAVIDQEHANHIVYKIEAFLSDSPRPAGLILDQTQADQPKPTPAPIPDTVYPEILVVVTNDLYEKLGRDIWYAVSYIVAFWNGVDLKYRYFENPKFRLNIAGVVLTEDDEVLEYIRAFAYNNETIKASEALRAGQRYWYARKDDILPNSTDVIITMTTKKLCGWIAKEKTCWPGILGQALLGAACRVDDYWQESNYLGLIRDNGAFGAIHTAAHELGHLFGAGHDGQQNEDCPSNDGYIMAGALHLTDKSSEWSRCSLRNIESFLRTNPVCLYNKPNQQNILPNYLPGRFMNADMQCAKLEGTEACNVGPSMCQVLQCYDKTYEDHPMYPRRCRMMSHAAADGTECGNGNFCVNGQCVRL